MCGELWGEGKLAELSSENAFWLGSLPSSSGARETGWKLPTVDGGRMRHDGEGGGERDGRTLNEHEKGGRGE